MRRDVGTPNQLVLRGAGETESFSSLPNSWQSIVRQAWALPFLKQLTYAPGMRNRYARWFAGAAW
jgi:hypothetical protein